MINFIAKRFIAGSNFYSAINYSRKINKIGLSSIINFLGEEIRNEYEIEKSKLEYIKLAKIINSLNLKACISVKLTQLGVLINEKYCYENLKEICEFSNFTWIDMESSKFTESSIRIYLKILKKFKNVGIAIQSYLRRSEKDLNRIIKSKGIIRLVKGAYRESPTIAFKNREEINGNYLKLMKILFIKSKNFFSIATHDEKLIIEAIRLSKDYNKNFEFAMLKGVRNNLKIKLLKLNYKVSEYVPYGNKWFPYFYRRIKEKPSNIFLIFI